MADGSKGQGPEPVPGPKIAICIPSTGSWKSNMGLTMASIASYSTINGLRLMLLNNDGSTVTASRNDLVTRALKLEPDWLFFYDTDMMSKPDVLLQLLKHDKDIVCATYNRRVPPFSTLGHLAGAYKDLSSGGLHEAVVMPGGVMLIRASVLKALGYPWFFETYEWDAVSPVSAFMKMLSDWSLVDMPLEIRSSLLANPGLVKWLDDNRTYRALHFQESRMISEDYNFCRKATKAGYKIWCDMDVTFETAHIGDNIVPCTRPTSPVPTVMEPVVNGGV